MCHCSCSFVVSEFLLNSPLAESCFETGQVFDLRLHDVVEPVEETRHRGHDCRPENSQVFLEFEDISLEEADLHSLEEAENVHESFENVSER